MPEGAPVTGALHNFPGARFRVSAGRCYHLSFALDQGVPALWAYPLFKFRTDGESRDDMGELLSQKQSGSSSLVCASYDGVFDQESATEFGQFGEVEHESAEMLGRKTIRSPDGYPERIARAQRRARESQRLDSTKNPRNVAKGVFGRTSRCARGGTV